MLRTRLTIQAPAILLLSAIYASTLTTVATFDLQFDAFRVAAGKRAPVTLRVPGQTPIFSSDQAWAHRLQPMTILRGSVPSPKDHARIDAYEDSRRPIRMRSAIAIWFGFFLAAALCGWMLLSLSPARGALLRTHIVIFLVVALTLVALKLAMLFTPLSPLWVPAAFFPLWLSLHMDRRVAYITSLLILFGVSVMAWVRPLYLVVFAASCLGVCILPRDRKYSSSYFLGAVLAGVFASLAYTSYRAFAGFPVRWSDEGELGLQSSAVAAFAGGCFAGIGGWSLQSILARAIATITRPKLVSLTDVDHPLLKKIAREAPGTWEHSRAMANLAEAAAAAIGADPLLCRVGAYFHDVGKTTQPSYFVENLLPGEPNPHDQLEPHVSAEAIISHVTEGVRMLRKAGIPESIVEFAYTHHGTSIIEYFWHRCLEQGNPHGLNEESFSYPGMKPRTQETAILMLVDAVEAASRTVTPEKSLFENLVLSIVYTKLRQGQLDESGLKPSDLRIIINRLGEALCSIYHGRIRYPWQDVPQVDLSRSIADSREPSLSSSVIPIDSKLQTKEEIIDVVGSETTHATQVSVRVINGVPVTGSTESANITPNAETRALMEHKDASDAPAVTTQAALKPGAHPIEEDGTYPGGNIGRDVAS